MINPNLSPTPILDFEHPSIQGLIAERGWLRLDLVHRIGAAYDYVRDEIAFGYNVSDELPASRVLADGRGQCNTKTSLLMALLRGLGVPCRFHGATIHKELQKGVVEGFFYRLAPEDIIHSWAEVEFGGRWVGLEGVILDRDYLDGLRMDIAKGGGEFLGYGAGTEDIENPAIEWCGSDTAIQSTGINHDFGLYDDPDAFYAEHGVNLSGLKGFLFRNLIRHRMNRRVAAIRERAGVRTTGSLARPSRLSLDRSE